MKNILITGKNSYIGTSVEKWLNFYSDDYAIDTIDLKDSAWRKISFSKYNVIFHVAGLAHVDIKKLSDNEKEKYYSVNRDLTIETARKAKTDGVSQFIFMSSIIVYGKSGEVGNNRIITSSTLPQPDNIYGDSKLQAEQGLLTLSDHAFTVTILRPPMIYGRGSKGNYTFLSKLAQKLPLFPDFNNERSVLFIDNLCAFIKELIDYNYGGIYFPQNREYVRTSQLVMLIGKAHNKKILLLPGFNWAVFLFAKVPGQLGRLVNKAFGSLIYEKKMSIYDDKNIIYQIKSLEESIIITECDG